MVRESHHDPRERDRLLPSSRKARVRFQLPNTGAGDDDVVVFQRRSLFGFSRNALILLVSFVLVSVILLVFPQISPDEIPTRLSATGVEDGSSSVNGSSPEDPSIQAERNSSVVYESQPPTLMNSVRIANGAENPSGGVNNFNGDTSNSLGGTSRNKKPNVIFVLIDDVGMNDLGIFSTDMMALTPRLDSLARQGIILTNYHSNHICTPARASLMTGRDAFLTGMQFETIENSAPWGLPLDEVTIAERFKAAGYATHMTGKWHLGMYTVDHYPFNRGFDTFLGYMGGAEGYTDHLTCVKGKFPDALIACYNDFGYGDQDGYLDTTANTTREGPDMVGLYSTDIFTDRALEVAKNHSKFNEGRAVDDQIPLFLYVSHQAAHAPIEHPPNGTLTGEEIEAVEKIAPPGSARRRFAKVMIYLDKMIGRMVDELESMGMMDNTLLVIASDNGGCPSGGGSNYPYRGMKHTLFEGGVRVPAMVYSTSESLIPAAVRGSRYDGLMHVTDWTPTLGHVAGLPLESMGRPLSGLNHWPALVGRRLGGPGGRPVRRELVLGRSSWRFHTEELTMMRDGIERGAFISDGWKIILGERCAGWLSFNPEDYTTRDTMCSHQAVCMSCTTDCQENVSTNNFLFNLVEDPSETVNLINFLPGKFEQLRRRWEELSEDEVQPWYRAMEMEARHERLPRKERPICVDFMAIIGSMVAQQRLILVVDVAAEGASSCSGAEGSILCAATRGSDLVVHGGVVEER